MQPARPITLYGLKLSGHSHRAELMLRLLDLPFAFEEVDIFSGVQRTPAFQQLNPFGTVPVIDDAGAVIPDSVAILVYLATRYDPERRWLPEAPAEAAAVQRWLSIAQGMVAFGPARARVVCRFGGKHDLAVAQELAHRLFKVMDGALAGSRFAIGATPTIADVALYSYTAVAPEGGVILDAYPAIRAWLTRVEALPRFEGMPQ